MTPETGAGTPHQAPSPDGVVVRERVWTLPNILTVSRIALLPPVVVLLWMEDHNGWARPWDASPPGPGEWTSFGAALLYLIAGLTDLIDGRIARHTGTQTVLGQLLDPLADKLVLTAGAVMLIPLGRIPAWVAFVLIAREVLVTGLRGIATTRGLVIAARPLGKYKASFQMISLNLLMLHYRTLGLNVSAIGNAMLVIAVVLTVYSGWDYFRAFLPGILAESDVPPSPTGRRS